MKLKDECIICLDSNLKKYDNHTTFCCGSRINIHRGCLNQWNSKENRCIICNKENLKNPFCNIFTRIRTMLCSISYC